MATTAAILGPARLANFRLGYMPAATAALRRPRIHVLLGGVDITLLTSTTRTLVGSVTVKDAINDNPNTASFVVKGTAPTVGQSVRISVGTDTPVVLFTGTVQTVEMSYVAVSTVEWNVTATDDLARLNARRPFGTWTNISATTIAQSLISTFAPGFTSTHVQAALPAISINLDGSEGFSGALRQIAALIGGYFYVDDLDLHLFQTEAADAPDAVDVTHPPLNDPPIAMTTDLSQIRTRVYGKGHGEALLADVAIGETILPVANADAWFNPAGGQAITDTQVLTYTGMTAGTSGSLVGPGAQPSSAPVVVPAAGSGITVGTHDWAYTWVTGAGETLPSPLATMLVGTATAPTIAPTCFATGASNPAPADLHTGDSVQYAYSWSTAVAIDDLTQETAMSPGTTITVQNIPSLSIPADPIVNIAVSADARVRWVHIWRNLNGGGYFLMAVYPSSDKGVPNDASYVSNKDGGLYGGITHSATTVERAALSGVAIGASGTTSRKVYRTVAGGSQLKLLATIADNTTTTYADLIADGSLGANAPVTDTSGLALTSGQVNAGSTSLLLASAGPFSSGGGWAVLGSQTVRYTGISGNTLTGIPASGPGALVSSVRYGEHADPAPVLTGVTGIGVALLNGAPVNVWVQRDDLSAQTSLAAMTGTDGIVEYLVSDERRNEASIAALCEANLALYSRPTVTVTYATRDTKTKSGKAVTITLANPAISQTLTIQDVNISEIAIAATLLPKFTVTASNVRFSLEAVLRQLIGKAA